MHICLNIFTSPTNTTSSIDETFCHFKNYCKKYYELLYDATYFIFIFMIVNELLNFNFHVAFFGPQCILYVIVLTGNNSTYIVFSNKPSADKIRTLSRILNYDFIKYCQQLQLILSIITT